MSTIQLAAGQTALGYLKGQINIPFGTPALPQILADPLFSNPGFTNADRVAALRHTCRTLTVAQASHATMLGMRSGTERTDLVSWKNEVKWLGKVGYEMLDGGPWMTEQRFREAVLEVMTERDVAQKALVVAALSARR